MKVNNIDRVGIVSVSFSESMVFSQYNAAARELVALITELDFILKVKRNPDSDDTLPTTF